MKELRLQKSLEEGQQAGTCSSQKVKLLEASEDDSVLAGFGGHQLRRYAKIGVLLL